MTSDQLQLISDAILSPHGIVFVMIYLTWRRFCYEFTAHGVVAIFRPIFLDSLQPRYRKKMNLKGYSIVEVHQARMMIDWDWVFLKICSVRLQAGLC